MIGQNLGAKQFARAQHIAKISALISFGILSGFGVLIAIFAPELIGLFIENTEANKDVISI